MIGFVIAMEKEADVLLRHMKIEEMREIHKRKIYRGSAFGKELALTVCGVGKVNAAAATEYLLTAFPVEKIVNFGLAGALNDSMEVGGVYPVAQSVEYDFDLAQLNGTPIGTLNECEAPYLPLSVSEAGGKSLATGDRFNDSAEDYRLLTQTLRADIRDMEGGAIVHTALWANVPVYAFKAISDVAGKGCTTEQYLQNAQRALEAMEHALGKILEAL